MGYYTWTQWRTCVKARSIHSHGPSVLTLDTEDCIKAPGLSCCGWTGSTSSSQMEKCLHNNLKQGRKTLQSNSQGEAGLQLPESPPRLCVLVCVCSPHKSLSSATDVSAPVCWVPNFFAATCCPWNFSCLLKSLTRKAKEPNWGP